MNHTVVSDGTLKRTNDMVLTSNFGKSTWSESPVQRMNTVGYLRE